MSKPDLSRHAPHEIDEYLEAQESKARAMFARMCTRRVRVTSSLRGKPEDW